MMAVLTLDWKKYEEVAVRAAEEGAVLLRNDGALPAAKGTKAALFGRMQSNYYKSGTGSGGMVNTGHVTTILEGLDNDPDIILDEKTKELYASWNETHLVDPGLGWGKERWSQDEMPLDEAFVEDAASRCSLGIMVIARTAGEDRDNSAEPGSYYLSDGEKDMIRIVCRYFTKTVILLNVGNVIDMSFVDDYGPSAVMYIWQAGMIGGIAAANLITGKAVPSGSLTDTIAYDLNDIPSNENFGNKDPLKDIYQEDIFVGYRYFSTFAPEKVRYPFGYGLSYTTFDIDTKDLSFDGSSVNIRLSVRNTGEMSGKKTVLVFVKAPSGKLSKPSLVLAGFSKTKELRPSEEEEIVIDIPRKYLASYDDDGRSGLTTGWILEKGDYVFYAGNDVADNKEAGKITIDEDTVVESLGRAGGPAESFKRLTSDGTYEDAPLRTVENVDSRLERVPEEIPQTGPVGIMLRDVMDGKNTLDEFIAQLTDEDLSLIIRGEGMSSPKVTTGTAAAFGGVSRELQALGIPALCCDDGPSGMRIDSGKKAFSLPNGTCLASTYNEELMEELFELFGIEMVSNEVDTILGPGINIHRHPLNGRNFEYFSEDPLLTGKIAAAQIRGLEKHHVTATIKHFCANNRETHRREMDSVVSEKALREIYMRGYEIAVKEGGARSIMSVYNMINGIYGTANYDINTVILREQWGYKGIVMTDWWAYIEHQPDNKYDRDINEHSMMARAQCDIYMVCSSVEREHLDEADTYENLKSGNKDEITRAELQRNAGNILRFAMDTPAMMRITGDAYEVKHVDCPFEGDNIETKVERYYNIPEDEIITVDADTEAGDDFVFGVTCSKPGRYTVTLTASSDLGELAQIPMTILYTSIPIRVLTWNGTDGKDVSQETTLRFLSKYTIFRAHFGGKGVKLKTIKFEFLCAPQDDPDKEF